MAEQDSRQQNHAFLQQLERQRRQKPCLRHIDLRGKVAGECQPYKIGSLTHYLDDRSYVLLKQLMERAGGQYTVGVYEALLEALKRFKALSATETAAAPQPNDDLAPELIRLDQAIRRREIRIQLVTPLQLKSGDVLYSASSVDLTSSAVRISMKRTFHLEQGQVVAVSFPGLQAQAPTDLLIDLPYKLVRLQHTEKYSFAVMAYCGDDDPALMNWWHNWLEQQNAAIDSNNELFNLAQQFYLRIFCRSLPSPLLWLNATPQQTTVKRLHQLPAAEYTLAAASQSSGNVCLPADTETEITVGVMQSKQLRLARSDNHDAFAEVIQATSEAQPLLLFQRQPIHLDIAAFRLELEVIRAIDSEAAEQLTEQLSTMNSLLHITDIQSITTHLSVQKALSSPLFSKPVSVALPEPENLRHYIRREDDRLVIRTPVTLLLGEQSFELITNEVSVNGLSVRLPPEIEVTNGMRVTVHFQRWQQQSPKLALNAVPYIVRNVKCWSNGTDLGLQRVAAHCPAEVNTFFRKNIEENRSKLALCYDDMLLSQQSRIFSSLLSQYWRGIPLFFGMDSEQKRSLHAVGLTEHNVALSNESLWKAVNVRAGRLTSEIKPQLSDERDSVTFGLYAYLNGQQDWVIITDNDLDDATAKTLFINKALRAPEQHFFHCHLVALKSGCLQDEQDLLAQLNNIPRNLIHRVRAVRNGLSHLFAVGHLTDIRAVIEATYQP